MPSTTAPSMNAIIAVRTTSSVSMPASCMPIDVVEVEAVYPLHHEHPSGDEGRMRARGDVAVLLEVVEHAGDVEHVGGLHAEVEFLDDRLGEQLDERRRVGERSHRDPPDQVRSEPRHHLEVLADQCRHLRSLHLDDDVLAGAQPRDVHLRDRRRGECGLVEELEHVVEARAEVLLDGAPNHVEGLGGNLVPALLELLDELGREQALARGDDLTQLDVRRAERLGGATQPERDVGAARLGAGVALQLLAHDPGHDGYSEMPDHGQHPQTRREPAWCGERRDLLLCADAQRAGQVEPARLVPLDGPRTRFGEGGPTAVRGEIGRVGHGSP